MTMKMKYATTTERQFYRDKRIRRVIKGLLKTIEETIVASEVPKFATRVKAAQKLLKEDL